MTPASDGSRRIERALSAYLSFRASGEEQAEFLARHSDLRDLLEGLLAEAQPEPKHGPGEGHVLGDFRLLREVGRGGMGVVYEARQLSLDRRVALKVLPPHLTLRASTVARFRREATIIAGLEHRNIVRVLAVGQDGDTHWFAMEFVEGTPLDRLLQERAGREFDRDWARRAVDIAAQVADALEHAHAAGVVHRDVKPANVLMRPDGTAVLTDFGVARDEDAPSVTLPGGRAGTPYYMSPEQVAGDRAAVDHRTDLFSLGVTLFEMLTARRPFDGDSTDAVLHAILSREAPDPRRYNAALHRDLAAIVLRALEKEPQRRYATARDFGDDLRAWLAMRPVKARPASTLARLRRWTKREPLKTALVAVLAAGVPTLAGLLGYLVARAPEIRAGQEKLLEDLLEQGIALGGGSHRDYEAAKATFERVLALAPGHEEGLAGMALVLERWEGAATALRFLDAHPDDNARSRGLRRLRALLLMIREARGEAESIEADLGTPVDAFEYLIAARCELARVYAGDRAALDRCIAYYSLATRLSPRPRLRFYLDFANVLIMTDDHAARLELARVLERLWAHSSRAWNQIGELLHGIDQTRSIAAYRRALTIYPDEWGLLYNLVEALRTGGETEAALAEAQRMVALYPGFHRCRAALGDCLLAKDRVAEGMAELERACAGAPDDHLINGCYGAALLRAGRPAEARPRLEKSLSWMSSQPQVARDLAQILLDTGETQPARRWLTISIAFAARDACAHDLLLRCLRELGDDAGVRAEQERWARVRPGS